MPAWLRTLSGKGANVDNGKDRELSRPISQETINIPRSPPTVLPLRPVGSPAGSIAKSRHTLSSFWKKNAQPSDPEIGLPVPDERTNETANHHMMRSILQSRAKTMISLERMSYDGLDRADPVARTPRGPPPDIPLPARPLFQDHRSVLFLYAAQPDDCRLELLDSLPEHQRVAVEQLALKVYDVMEKEGLEMCDAFEMGWDEDEKSFVEKPPPPTDKNSPIKLKKRGTKKEKNRTVSTPARHLPSAPFSKTNRTFTDPTILPRALSPTTAKFYSGGNILHFKKRLGTPQGEYPKMVAIPGAEEEEIIELNDPKITLKWLKDTAYVTTSDQLAFVEELNSENPKRSMFPPLPLTSGGGQYSGASRTPKRERPLVTTAANRNFQRIVDAFIAKELGVQKYKTILDVALDQRSFGEDAVLQRFMAIIPDQSLLDEDDPLHGPSALTDSNSCVGLARFVGHQQTIRDEIFDGEDGSLRSEKLASTSRSFATLKPQASNETIVHKPQTSKRGGTERKLSSTIIYNPQVLGASQSMGDLSSSLRSATPTPVDGQEGYEQNTPTLNRATTTSGDMKRMLTMSNLHASQLRDEYGGVASSDIYSDADEITTPIPFSATIAAGDNARNRRHCRFLDTGKQVEEIDDLSWNATVASQSGFKKRNRKSVQYLNKKRVVSQRLDEESSKGKDLLTPAKLKMRKELDEAMENKTKETADALMPPMPLSPQGQFETLQLPTLSRKTDEVNSVVQSEPSQFLKPPSKADEGDSLFEFLMKEVSDDGYSSPLEDGESTELMGKMGSQNFHYRKTLTTFSKDSEETESLLAASAANLGSLPVIAGSGVPHLRARRSSRRLGSSPLANPPIVAEDILDSEGIVANGATEGVFGDALIANGMPIQHHPFRDPPTIPQLTGHAEGIIPSSPTNKYSGSVGRLRQWKDYTTSPPRELPSSFIESARDRQDISNNFKWKERVDRKQKPDLRLLDGELEEFKQSSPGLPSLETRNFIFEKMTGCPVPLSRPSQDQEQMWHAQRLGGKFHKCFESEESKLKKLYSDQIDENGVYRTPDIDSGGDIAPPAPVSLRKNAFEVNQRVPSSPRLTNSFNHEMSMDETLTQPPGEILASKPSRFARFGLGSRNAPSRDNMVLSAVASSPPVRTEAPKLTKKKHRLQSFLPSSGIMPKFMAPQTRIVIENRPADRSPERIPYEDSENESGVHRLPNSQTAADFQIFAKSAVAFADRKRDSRMN